MAGRIYGALHGRIWAGHNIVAFDMKRIVECFSQAQLRCALACMVLARVLACRSLFHRRGMSHERHTESVVIALCCWGCSRSPPTPAGVIDTLPLLRSHFGKHRAGDLKLSSLGHHFRLGEEKHRALADARMTLGVLRGAATVLFLEEHCPAAMCASTAARAPGTAGAGNSCDAGLWSASEDTDGSAVCQGDTPISPAEQCARAQRSTTSHADVLSNAPAEHVSPQRFFYVQEAGTSPIVRRHPQPQPTAQPHPSTAAAATDSNQRLPPRIISLTDAQRATMERNRAAALLRRRQKMEEREASANDRG